VQIERRRSLDHQVPESYDGNPRSSFLDIPGVRMTRIALGLAAAALLSACADTDTAAPTAPTDAMASLGATTTHTKIPINMTVVQFEPCANEVLRFQIRQQLVVQTTTDPRGTVHETVIINDKGTKAVGTVTGRVWNQTGATTNHINITPAITGTQTVVNSLNLIGRGRAPDFRITEVFHITVNRHGIAVEFSKLRTSCR
jgi:hypothetical protein